jgi:hypothetical protein
MLKKLSRKDAALWLSEAWGRDDIRPRHVRHLGNWLFVDDPQDTRSGEVECIHAPKSGDIWAEPWSGIPFIESPFVEKDQAKLAKTLAKLDDGIANYIAKYNLED